jgi:hypothetical protein
MVLIGLSISASPPQAKVLLITLSLEVSGVVIKPKTMILT